MAEKSLVNADAETLGPDAAAELLAVDELPLELELDDELPQAATPRLAITPSAAITALPLRKCTLIFLSS